MPHTGCIMLKSRCPRPDTAKRILERCRIQTSSASEFDWYVFLNLKPISGLYNFLFFWHLYGLVFDLCMIYQSSFYPISYPFGIYIAWFFIKTLLEFKCYHLRKSFFNFGRKFESKLQLSYYSCTRPFSLFFFLLF